MKIITDLQLKAIHGEDGRPNGEYEVLVSVENHSEAKMEESRWAITPAPNTRDGDLCSTEIIADRHQQTPVYYHRKTAIQETALSAAISHIMDWVIR